MSELAEPVVAMAAPPPRLGIPRLGRLRWLMGLYAENFRAFAHLFPVADLAPGRYRSSVADGRDLHLDVLERQPYTTILRLTYAEIIDPVSGEADPSAYLRLYHDSRQLEATHCYIGRNWQDVIGLRPPAATLVEHRLRMNTFLGKWLDYLRECGHQRATLRTIATTQECHRPAALR